MEDYSKIMAAVILGAVCVLAVRRNAPEISFALSLLLAAGAAAFGLALFGGLAEFIAKAAQMAGLPEEWLNPVYKTVGIAVITRFSSDLMKDTGQLGAAAAVDFAGVLAALAAARPLLEAMLSLLSGLA